MEPVPNTQTYSILLGSTFGATTTLISKRIAEFLKIKPPNKIEKIGGAGGNFEAYSCNITRMIITKGNIVLNDAGRIHYFYI